MQKNLSLHFAGFQHACTGFSTSVLVIPCYNLCPQRRLCSAQCHVCSALKLLSVDPQNYPDAPREGIRRILEQLTGKKHPRDEKLDTSRISSIRMGTTVSIEHAATSIANTYTSCCLHAAMLLKAALSATYAHQCSDLQLKLPRANPCCSQGCTQCKSACLTTASHHCWLTGLGFRHT